MMKNECNRYIIFDLEQYELSQEEKELLQHPHIAGVILFSRNYHDKQQLFALNKAIKKIAPHCIISVDQEGGRVQRFREGFSMFPPMSHWGEQYQISPVVAKQELFSSIQKLCQELLAVGINLNFIPVLDINNSINEIIGNRSLHHDPNIVIELAEVIIRSLNAAHMPAVGKHFPGHGSVAADSHCALPRDEREFSEIAATDLLPFKALAAQLAMIMPAHIIFNQCDESLVTYSTFWLQTILRHTLNFNGVIISDDLTMVGAASVGDYDERSRLALEAGIDLLLICNHRAGTILALESLENLAFNPLQYQRLQILDKTYGISNSLI